MINLYHSEFLTVLNDDDRIVGCGRVIEHKSCDEIASIVIDKQFRGMGIGKQLVQALIDKSTRKSSCLFLMCEPALEPFYNDLEFIKYCDNIPLEMLYKHRKYSDGLSGINNDNIIIMIFNGGKK